MCIFSCRAKPKTMAADPAGDSPNPTAGTPSPTATTPETGELCGRSITVLKALGAIAGVYLGYKIATGLYDDAYARGISYFKFGINYDRLGQFTVDPIREDQYLSPFISKQQCPASFIDHLNHQTEYGYWNNYDVKVLEQLYGFNRDASDEEVREFYEALVGNIPYSVGVLKDTIAPAQNKNCLDVAAAVSEMRGNARLYARHRSGFFSELFLQIRDLFEYGNPNGPRFSSTLVKYQKKTLSDTCEAIFKAASRSNAKVTAAVRQGGIFNVIKAFFKF